MKNSYFRLQFISTFLGNVFEHYDLALYSLLSPFFASIFFPQDDHLSALILTYTVIPIGMLTRPLGALVFGYVGDHYGRRTALSISLFGLAVVSIFLACSPTYNQVGLFAPVYLIIGRLLQNFFGIGENLGGGIYLLEQSKKRDQDLISGLYGSSTVAGFLLASTGVSLLYYYQLLETHWRLLYVIGGLTSLFAWILRRNLPVEIKVEKIETVFRIKKTFSLLWENRQTIFIIALIAGFSYANSSIAFVFFNGFIPLVSSVSKEQMVHLNTFLLLFDCMMLPLCGLLAKYFSRQKIMLSAAILIALFAFPLFSLLENASLAMVILIRVLIVSFGVCFTAPFHSWAQNLVSAANRYTFISFGYAIGSQLIGGIATPFSLWIYKQTQSVELSALYWVTLAAIVSSFLYFTSRKSIDKTVS